MRTPKTILKLPNLAFSDGNRDLVLHYVSQTTSKDGFVVVLKDISRDIFVELHYTVDEATGILGRSAITTNRTKQPLTIEQAAAASWNLPSGADYSLRYLSGRWAAEDNLNQQQILPGKTGTGKPSRIYQAPEQSMVRHRARQLDGRR